MDVHGQCALIGNTPIGKIIHVLINGRHASHVVRKEHIIIVVSALVHNGSSWQNGVFYELCFAIAEYSDIVHARIALDKLVNFQDLPILVLRRLELVESQL